MKVYISYSRKDEALADNVVTSLEEAGIDAWYGKREIMPGENWGAKIAQGLKESDAMVVLLTPNSVNSDSVHMDIEFALSGNPFSGRLIPVIVGDSAEFSSEIPWILKRLKTVKLPEHGRNKEQLKQIANTLKEVA